MIAVTGAGFYIGIVLIGDEPNRFAADRLTAPGTPPAADRGSPRADRAQRDGGANPAATPSTSASPSAPGTSPRASRAAQPRTSASITKPAPSQSPSADPTQSAPVQRRPEPSPAPAGQGPCEASFYDGGGITASGEPFDPNGLTAAHPDLPFGTQVKVTNTASGDSVIVRINDRGPSVAGRCIDLARGAFEQVASVDTGVITVRLKVV